MAYTFNPFSGNFDNAPSTLKGDNAYSNLQSNSATWVDAFETGTVYKANSASYATVDFANNKFFPLSGGTIAGNTRINGNVTIFGDLSSTGTQTFANTIFATTSSLSVVHVGSGPAVWVGNNGSGDIASFYDMDQEVEVLHVGGANGDFPNVGVKTSTPNKDFTVNGEISSSNTIWDSDGNSNQWNSAYSTVNSNSATTWDNALANSYTHANFLPLSGGNVSGVLEAGTGSISLFVSANKVGVNTEAPNQALTVVGSISASGVISASASNVKVNVVNNSADRIFSDTDNNKVIHFDTTTSSLCAIFPSSLSNGFNVAIMNVGTNQLVLSAADLKSIGATIATQYGGAFVYKDSDNLFAVGRLS